MRTLLARVSPQPDLRWGSLYLVQQGEAVVSAYHCGPTSLAAGEDLAARILEETGVECVVSPAPADAGAMRDAVVLVDLSADSRARAALSTLLPGVVSPTYPRRDAYVLHRDDQGRLWILAYGGKMLTLACGNLLNACDLSPTWFSPEIDRPTGVHP